MKKITIKLNKVGLRGHSVGSIIEIDPTDSYWRRRLAECEGTDYIEVLTDPAPKPKATTAKAKSNKQES